MTLTGPRDGREGAPRLRGRAAELLGVQPDVELRQMEPEELDPAAEGGQPSVGEPCAPVRPQAAVDDVEVGRKLGRRGVAARAPRRRLPEAVPDERELAPVGLVALVLPTRAA